MTAATRMRLCKLLSALTLGSVMALLSLGFEPMAGMRMALQIRGGSTK
jgi:hypothetical protein